jgi:DNA-binding IclR family transcriptional regulator
MGYDLRVVKSAKRVLEVLEYFNQVRRRVTVLDVARDLDYPQSSASELLRSLYTLGYLNYDRRLRVYWPAARVALLGSWVSPELFRCGRLLPMMDRVHQETGRLVALGAPVGLKVQYIHVLPATPSAAQSAVAHGGSFSLLRTAMGQLFLSLQESTSIRQIVLRVNAEEECPERRVSLKSADEMIAAVRRNGYAYVADECGKGAGMVAILLPSVDQNAPLALGMGYRAGGHETPAEAAEFLRQRLQDHLVDFPAPDAAPQPPQTRANFLPRHEPVASSGKVKDARRTRSLHAADHAGV